MTSNSHRVSRGDSVRVRGERWRVVHVAAYETCNVVELAGADASNAGCIGRFILPFEPLDRLAPGIDRPRVVRRAAWARAAAAVLAQAAPAWSSLRAAARANVILLPYQLEPALAMTRGAACRFLLADEVGLGKTIQAGLLVAELLVRERDARALIVTPAGLRDQWREELHDRFAIEAVVIDAAALVRATAHLPTGVNPWAIPRVAIASIDFVKRPDVLRSLEPLVWDLVAFDEAHALCGRSDRAVAADLVAARARRVVIITATPHSGDEGAFERLRAIGRLGEPDPLLVFRRSRVEAGMPGQRVMRRLSIAPNADEARMHRALEAYADRVSREAPVESAAAARLAMIVLARRASSSAVSLARSIERRMALLQAPPEEAAAQMRLPLEDGQFVDDEEPFAELGAPGLTDAGVEQRSLRRILALARAVAVESKVQALRRLLTRTGEPALVFTEYRDTLRHLVSVLDPDAAVLHGGLTTAERRREARRFTHGSARLLIATDAASEGLNLQRRCRLVISLDVPWTPLRLEQRIGRVDRLGQTRRVHAITFVARGTPEERVAAALTSRAVRAERDAPFGPSDVGSGALNAAAEEAMRLETVRSLTRFCRSGCDLPDRPVLAVLSPRHRLMIAVRMLFVDSTGAIAWETVRGFAFPAGDGVERQAAGVRSWFERSIGDHATSLAVAAIVEHEAELAAVQQDVRAALHPLIARERAMLDRLTSSHGRMAAPLVQAGLFDRRALRDADAQRRLIQEATASAEARIAALERHCDVSAGNRTSAFAVVWAR